MAILSGSGSTPSNETQFALVGFAMGVVTGARSFKVDKLGRLMGVVHAQVWKPGENLAECRKRNEEYYPLSASYNVRTYTDRDIRDQDRLTGEFIMFDGQRIPESAGKQMLMSNQPISVPVMDNRVSVSPLPSGKPSKQKDHSLTDCEHGFYGYYDGSDDYHKDGMVSGVIEGYGESLIGTRGFRCMKAKIVALTISKDLAKPVAELVHRNYKDVPQFVTFEQMVKAFPPDHAGMQPAPETDEDFWTRSI